MSTYGYPDSNAVLRSTSKGSAEEVNVKVRLMGDRTNADY